MNFFFLLLVVVFWGLAAYSVYAAIRGYEYGVSRVGLGEAAEEAKDFSDIVIEFLFSIVSATFGAVLRFIFGRWGPYAIFIAQAVIFLALGAVMLWLGILFA
jgi:hypothetical protein